MTIDEASKILIELNPRVSFLLQRELHHRFNELSNAISDTEKFYIHVHYGDDAAGMRKHKMFNGELLDLLVTQAIAFTTECA